MFNRRQNFFYFIFILFVLIFPSKNILFADTLDTEAAQILKEVDTSWFSKTDLTTSSVRNGLIQINNQEQKLREKGIPETQIKSQREESLSSLKDFAKATYAVENTGAIMSLVSKETTLQSQQGNLKKTEVNFLDTIELGYKKAGIETSSIIKDVSKELEAQANEHYAKSIPDTSAPSSGLTLVPGAGGTYTLLAPLGSLFGDSVDVAGGGLGGYLNGLYRAGIAIATGLALIMIVVGGLEYVSVDSIQGKSNGRERIKNALLGLLLALTSYIILRQINPNLLKSDLQVDSVASIGGIEGSAVSLKGEEVVIVQNIQDASQNALLYGFNPAGGVGGIIGNAVGSAVGGVAGGPNGVWWGYENVRKLLSSIPNGKRSTDGSLIFSNYWNGDTNTNQQRGNNCNLLVSGSVALSPDLIRTRKPRLGSAVMVNSLVVGYFNDTTSESAEGTLIRNTIDIYDPKISYGRILKKMPPGSWTLSFGEVRKQASNPCK